MTTEEDLYGAWHLTRWVYTIDGTFRGDAMGEDAKGQIIYSPDGHMSAILMRNDRATLPAATWPQATRDQRDSAALGYVSYGGSWDLADEVVSHHVAFALFPNWIGTDLVREVSWEGETLVLTGLPETTTTGKSVVNRLSWERARR